MRQGDVAVCMNAELHIMCFCPICCRISCLRPACIDLESQSSGASVFVPHKASCPDRCRNVSILTYQTCDRQSSGVPVFLHSKVCRLDFWGKAPNLCISRSVDSQSSGALTILNVKDCSLDYHDSFLILVRVGLRNASVKSTNVFCTVNHLWLTFLAARIRVECEVFREVE